MSLNITTELEYLNWVCCNCCSYHSIKCVVIVVAITQLSML